MAYTLRSACAEDLEAMMVIAHEGLRPYVEALWGWDAEDQQERYRAQLNRAALRSFVLTDMTSVICRWRIARIISF